MGRNYARTACLIFFINEISFYKYLLYAVWRSFYGRIAEDVSQTLDSPSIEEKHGRCMYIGNRNSDALHFLNVEALKPFKVLLYLNFHS